MTKAKQRIRSLIEQSEILVLASHDFQTLESICDRGLVFHHGQLIFDGKVGECIQEYKKVNKLS
ncbi:hypothetical protein D3C78_1320000 [compost metagenome]